MKTKISWANCSITVIGTEMVCPLCGVLVQSGDTHHCSKEEKPAPKRRRRALADAPKQAGSGR